MSKINLDLQGLSTLEKIAKVRQIVTSMSGNVNFTTPLLAQLTTSAEELESVYAEAEAARQAVQTETRIMRDKEETLVAMLRQIAAYIKSVGGENDPALLSAGIDVRSLAFETVSPAPPDSLSATDGDREGEIDLLWDRVKDAKSYIIEHCSGPPTPTSWGYETVVVKSKATIKGLIPNTRYWFRVAAVFSEGRSDWSDPVTKIVPFN